MPEEPDQVRQNFRVDFRRYHPTSNNARHFARRSGTSGACLVFGPGTNATPCAVPDYPRRAWAEAVHLLVAQRAAQPRTRRDELALTPDATAWLRITTLIEPLSALMLNTVLPNLPETVTIGEATLRVAAVATTGDEHPWAGKSSHAELLQQHTLASERPDRRIALRFASPTTFRREKSHLPVPLPDLIVQGWLARWNAFSGASLPDEVYRYAVECLAISRYNLRTEAVRLGPSTLIGCVGNCSYYALNADPYWLRLMHTLVDYSFFCGTGHKTTQGLGRTRSVGNG